MGIIGTKIYLSITQTVFSDFYPRLSARICEGPVNRAELGCVFCNSVAPDEEVFTTDPFPFDLYLRRLLGATFGAFTFNTPRASLYNV
jgi:hypothetical protein